jgi:dienelactone hydrolase
MKPIYPAIVTLFTVASLSGCASTNELYTPERTPLAVEVNDTVEIARPHHDQPLKVRTIFPAAGGLYPAIILSHGTFSNFERYDRVARYWAENGYVVLMPQHIDANYGETPKGVADMVRIVGTRVADMSLILDQLDSIYAQAPSLADKVDATRIVSAGHSIGTLVSMRVTGLVINDINTQQVISNSEDRFVALVMLSDPGKMRQMPITAWTGSTVPTFMSTGTEDYGLMGSRDEPTKGNEILSNDLSVDRYQLLLQEGDHYFGGLVQKDVEKNPDYEGLDIFNKTSTAFLDAYVKGDRSAARYLRNIDLVAATSGRAELILELARAN